MDTNTTSPARFYGLFVAFIAFGLAFGVSALAFALEARSSAQLGLAIGFAAFVGAHTYITRRWPFWISFVTIVAEIAAVRMWDATFGTDVASSYWFAVFCVAFLYSIWWIIDVTSDFKRALARRRAQAGS